MDLILEQICRILDAGSNVTLRVTGTSMVPFLRHRKDSVTLVPFDGQPKPGDILFYLVGEDRPILHRFHKRMPDGQFFLCGDHQMRKEFIRPEQVLAKVTVIHRQGKEISADSPLWRMLSLLWIRLYPVRKPLLALIEWVWRVCKHHT